MHTGARELCMVNDPSSLLSLPSTLELVDSEIEPFLVLLKAYMPPFVEVPGRRNRLSGAKKRKQVGQNLSGACPPAHSPVPRGLPIPAGVRFVGANHTSASYFEAPPEDVSVRGRHADTTMGDVAFPIHDPGQPAELCLTIHVGTPRMPGYQLAFALGFR